MLIFVYLRQGRTAITTYFPGDETIKAPQSQVSPCPLGFPAGCYLYGVCASLLKWAASLFKEQTQNDATDQTQINFTESDTITAQSNGFPSVMSQFVCQELLQACMC